MWYFIYDMIRKKIKTPTATLEQHQKLFEKVLLNFVKWFLAMLLLIRLISLHTNNFWHYFNTFWHFVSNLFTRSSQFSSLVFIKFQLCFSFIQMFAKALSASTFGQQLLSGARSLWLWNKAWREKPRLWLHSAGYLWRGSIHPFVLCGQGQCGWEFWEVKDVNEATLPQPLPKMLLDGEVPLGFEIRCSRVQLKHTHL